jgi:hypothetical protein
MQPYRAVHELEVLLTRYFICVGCLFAFLAMSTGMQVRFISV